jgi:hypothetical protein
MTVKNIKDAAARHKPLTINLSNGDQLTVPHTDYLLFAPPVAGEVFIVVDATGRIHIIDAAQVVDITMERQEP